MSDAKPAEVLKHAGTAVAQLPLFTVIPKGLLTKLSSWVQGLVGLLLLIEVGVRGVQTGAWPSMEDIDLLLGLLFVGQAGQGMGLARKIEAENGSS